MDFHFWSEIKVVRKVVNHVSAPCLLCDQKTEYGLRIGRSMGKRQWLEKCFEPRARKLLVKHVRVGVVPNLGRKLTTLEALLCQSCLDKLPEIRREHTTERQAALDRQYERSIQHQIDQARERL